MSEQLQKQHVIDEKKQQGEVQAAKTKADDAGLVSDKAKVIFEALVSKCKAEVQKEDAATKQEAEASVCLNRYWHIYNGTICT